MIIIDAKGLISHHFECKEIKFYPCTERAFYEFFFVIVTLSERTMSLRWTRLSCPLRCTKSCCPSRYASPMASISDTEFVLAHHHEDFSGLCTCNSEENKWNKIEIKYPDNFALGIHSIAVDSKSNTVYICTQTQLLSISLGKNEDNDMIKKQQCEILSEFYFEKVGQIFYISDVDEIHIINFRNHHILDLKSEIKELKQNYDLFGDLVPNYDHNDNSETYLDPGSMIYVHSRKCIIGRSIKINENEQEINNSISEFSLITNKWHHYKEWIPLNIVGRIGRSVITKNEDYVFSIGTQEWLLPQNELKNMNKILIYDINENDFKVSGSKLPSEELSFITITNNEIRDELLVYGYIHYHICNRYCCKNEKKHKLLIPIDIINFIKTWICYETVHFVADNYDQDRNGADHWTIDVDQILEKKEKITMMKCVA